MPMKTLVSHQKAISECRACAGMCGTPVHGGPVAASILLIGQAPGPHEAGLGKPFAYTAGKTLFKWLQESTALDEEAARRMIYFAAVARCFPGKNPQGGGDREPDKSEIENCRKFLVNEVKLLQPKLILPVGKLAIREVLALPRSFSLESVIGKRFFRNYHGHSSVIIPLPHPSGISRWHKVSPGKDLLQEALGILRLEFNGSFSDCPGAARSASSGY